MAPIAQSNPILGVEHLCEQRRDGDEMMGFGRIVSAVDAGAMVGCQDLLRPGSEGLGRIQVSPDLGDAAFPVVAIAATGSDREPLPPTRFAAHLPVDCKYRRDVLSQPADDAGEVQLFRVGPPTQQDATAYRAGLALTKLGRSPAQLRGHVDPTDGADFVKVCLLHPRILSPHESVQRNGVNCGNATEALTPPLCQSAAKPSDSAAIEPRQREGSETRAEETITPTSAPPERDEIVHPSWKREDTGTETEQTFTVNTHQAIAQEIDDIAQIQSKYDLRAETTMAGSYALARAMDLSGGNLFDDNVTQSVGTLGAEPTYANWLRGRQYLRDSAAKGKLVAVLPPASFNGLLNTEQFINALYNGDQQGRAVHEAQVGTIFKTTVYESQLCPGTAPNGYGNWWAAGHFFKIVQRRPTTHTWYSPLAVAWICTMDQIYGMFERLEADEAAAATTTARLWDVRVAGVK